MFAKVLKGECMVTRFMNAIESSIIYCERMNVQSRLNLLYSVHGPSSLFA